MVAGFACHKPAPPGKDKSGKESTPQGKDKLGKESTPPGKETPEKKSAPPDMARIPAGCFKMGDAFKEGDGSELPVHEVCITKDFFMDLREVTNGDYQACVDKGKCAAPGAPSSFTRGSYYGKPTYKDYPVMYVDWSQATAYCKWAGKRLPSEAQWEYAARGGLSGKRYAWGDDISCSNANYGREDLGFPCFNQGGLENDTQKVGGYAPNGYGLYDMAGNVLKWVNDWHSESYYGASPKNDPPGPDTGTDRVLRGGSWGDYPYNLRVSRRDRATPDYRSRYIGFRCAGD